MGGERQEEGKISSSSFSVATNWSVVHGSLQDSVSFESSIFSISQEDDHENAWQSKDCLILQPPPRDSCPCEINVMFTQKHEVCQVYVRSTARVYEIYYATEGQSDKEYLCTVRCGVAEREGMVLHTGDEVVELLDGNSKTGKTSQDSSRSNSSDEDGWVEVKIPDSPFNGTDATDRNIKTKSQDYYEATAEITDSSPCISITLRLLSLQVKESLHIEEIYIYADPTEPGLIDSQSQNSTGTGSNVLAMLVPSLLQLSRSKCDKIQEKHDIREGQISKDAGSRPTMSIGSEARMVQKEIFSTVQQEVHSRARDAGALTEQSPNSDSAVCTNLGSLGQMCSVEDMQRFIPGEESTHIKRMLDHLDSRMGRIEAFCARFEENMLKPLNCMATRLDQLEEKLDALVARSHSSTSVSCLRFVAPEFSVGESESNDNSRSPTYDASESVQDISDPSHKKQFSSDDNVIPLVEPAPELRPCLVVTAPEFSTEDDYADKCCDNSLESVRKDLTASEFPDVNDRNKEWNDNTAISATNDCHAKKASLSVDDALASALSAFISSASTQIPKLSATLRVKAPDFANEDDDSVESSSPKFAGASEDPNISCNVSNGLESSESAACIPTTQESTTCAEGDMKCPQGVLMEGMCYTRLSAEPTLIPSGLDMTYTDCSSTEKSGNGAATVAWQMIDGAETSNTETSSEEEVLGGKKKAMRCMDKHRADAIEGKSLDHFSSALGIRNRNVGHNEDESGDKLSQTSKSVLDFNIPILDVKFSKQKDGTQSLPLEKLLWDKQQEAEIQRPDDKEDGDDSDAIIAKQNHLVWMDDTDLTDTASCYEVENINDPSTVADQQEIFSSLI